MRDSEGQPVRIAVDAMGGDHAPGEIVAGAIQAAREHSVGISLVGDMAALTAETKDVDVASLDIRLVEAAQTIADGEQPAIAVMRKPNSSVALAARLVKEGAADGMVSAGSTGAAMVAALMHMGTLPGIERPVIGGAFLQLAPNCIVLDLGANVGCLPYQMVNFGAIGTVFARTFMGIDEPTVGLLNVGSEEGKGNDQAKEAHSLLKESGLNFIGNVEGMDIPRGSVNVVLCDGFVGNILMKYSEGLGGVIRDWLLQELSGDVPPDRLAEVTDNLHRLVSAGEVAGGGPMWGVDGVACVAHGASKAPQITRTIEQAKLAVESGMVDKLREELARAQGTAQS